MAQLTRARDRSMHSVVATIQEEQDEAIRAPAQGRRHDRGRPRHRQDGGRAAPRRLPAVHRPPPLRERRRARGRPDGRLHALHRAGAAVPRRDRGRAALARRGGRRRHARSGTTTRRSPTVKGSARMAEVLRRTARRPVPGAPTEFRIFYRDDVLDARPARAVRDLRRQLLAPATPQPLAPQGGRRADRRAVAPGRAASGLVSAAGTSSSTRCAATRVPRVRARLVAGRSTPSTCSAGCATRSCSTRVADGVLEPTRSTRLLAKSLGRDDFSVEDVPLLDELRYLLGDAAHRSRSSSDDPLDAPRTTTTMPELTTVDRARVRPARPQLAAADAAGSRTTPTRTCSSTRRRTSSPMQWRMVGRRGRYATWTIVGDPAQSSWPVPDEAAAARAEALRGQGRSTPSACRPTTATPPRSSTRRGVRRARRSRRRPARAPSARPASSRECSGSSTDLDAGASATRVASSARSSRARSASSAPVARRPRCAPGSGRGWTRARTARSGVRCPDRGARGARHQGPGVRRHRRGRARRDRGRVAGRHRATLYVVLTRATQQLDVGGDE